MANGGKRRADGSGDPRNSKKRKEDYTLSKQSQRTIQARRKPLASPATGGSKIRKDSEAPTNVTPSKAQNPLSASVPNAGTSAAAVRSPDESTVLPEIKDTVKEVDYKDREQASPSATPGAGPSTAPRIQEQEQDSVNSVPKPTRNRRRRGRDKTGISDPTKAKAKIRKLAPPRPYPTVPTSVSATGPRSAHTEGKNIICITRRTPLGAYLRRCKDVILKDGYVYII